jgi:hypothetical protein
LGKNIGISGAIFLIIAEGKQFFLLKTGIEVGYPEMLPYFALVVRVRY